MRIRIPKLFPRETLAMALDSVRSHKFRSFLTVLGIVIGVMTAISIASLLTGLRQSIVAMIEEYGTNNIYAFHLTTGPRTSTDRAERLRKPLTMADADAIKMYAPSVEDIANHNNIRALVVVAVGDEPALAHYHVRDIRVVRGDAFRVPPTIVVPLVSDVVVEWPAAVTNVWRGDGNIFH